MPTERFKRLPEEKIEAIRRAGIQEFTRTSPESASINRSLEHTILHANDGGFMGMVTRLIGSKTFFDLFKESVEGEKGEDHMECKRSYLDRIYGLLDQTRFPMDFRTFTDLMDLHAITLVMALKKKLNGECGTQEAMDFYNRRINLLRYGVCPQRAEKEKTE